jgi:CHAD domain-containing protein
MGPHSGYGESLSPKATLIKADRFAAQYGCPGFVGMPVEQERIHSLFQKLGRELSKVASKPQPKTVHQFRTATRRVEALVGLWPEQDRNARKLLKQLGRLRRRAGKVRDLDVLIADLRTLKVSEEPGRKAQVLRALTDQRSQREQRLIEALDQDTVRQIRKRLKRAATLVLPATDPTQLATRLFADLARKNETLSEQVLHQYRIEGKRIRYIAELGGEDPHAQHIVAELKRMQDAIGEWHDWLTLSETTQKLWTDGRPSAMLSALNNITRAKYRDAIEAVNETKAALLTETVNRPKPMARRKPAESDSTAVAAIA